ncbi:MAG: tetratricopeptide repeat protein [Patescibacteria group bacterium]|nr:tetratricopeptide repeat protein [Patescibacteria group bacterium]
MKEKIYNIFLKGWRPFFWLVLIGFILYAKTLSFNFVYLDDNRLILDLRDFITNPANIIKSFQEDVFISSPDAYYRPLLTVSLIFNALIAGTSPALYHLTNIIIHILAGYLLFLVLMKLNYRKELSFAASLIFVVHPVLTQAVAWIPGRNDSLMAVFLFSSFYFFLRFLEKNRRKNCFFHLLFFLLALLTKESSLFLPLLVIFYFQFIHQEKIPFCHKTWFLVGWATAIAAWFLLRQNAFRVPLEMGLGDLIKSVCQGLPALPQFIGKVIFPFNLTVLPIIQDTSFIYGIIAFVLIVGLIIFSKTKRWNYLIFGFFWFLVFLLPSFIRPNAEIVVDFLEHRLYVPLVGLLIVFLEIAGLKSNNGNKKWIAIIFLATIFSIITFFHSNNFQNRLVFWQKAAKNSPHSPLAQRNLGAMYFLDQRYQEAEQYFKKAEALNPFEPMVHNNLGLIYFNQNDFDKAEAEFEQEIKINPNYDNVYFNYGLLKQKQNKNEEAIALWEKTIKINHYYLGAYAMLINVYQEQGNEEKKNEWTEKMEKIKR